MTNFADEVTPRPLRFWIALVVWLLCLPGMYFHVAIFGFETLGHLVSGDWLTSFDALDFLFVLLLFLSTFSWFALARMSIGWIEDQPVHWTWPAVGTALTLPVLVPAQFIAALFVLPGVVFALFLCGWHLRGWHRQARTA